MLIGSSKLKKKINNNSISHPSDTYKISVQSVKRDPRYRPKPSKWRPLWIFGDFEKFSEAQTGPSTVTVPKLVYRESFVKIGAAVLFSDFSRVGFHGSGVSQNF